MGGPRENDRLDAEDRVQESDEGVLTAERERELSAAVLDTVGALIVVLDREGRIVRFNQRCSETTGYTFEEVRGVPFWNVFLLPEEASGVREVFMRLTAGDLPNQHTNHWIDRRGDRRLVSWTNTGLFDAGGQVEFVIGTGIDITEQRAAEIERNRLAAIVEATPDIISYATPDASVLYLNRAARQSAGFAEDAVDLAEVRVADCHPEWARRIVEEVGVPTAIESGFWQGRTAVLAGDGREIPVSQVILAHRSPNGELESLSTICRDTTEEVRVEQEREELLRRIEHQRRLVESVSAHSPTGIALLDGESFEIKWTNAAFASLCDVGARDHLVGRKVCAVIESASGLDLRNVVREASVKGDRVERVFAVADGERFWNVQVLHVPRSEGEMGPGDMIVQVSDVTDQMQTSRRVEELAAEAQHRAEELDAIILALVDALIVFDANGAIVKANPAARELLGIDSVPTDRVVLAQSLQLKKPDGSVMAPEEYPSTRSLNGEVVRGEEVLITTRDGEQRILQLSCTPLWSRSEITGVVSVVRDVTTLREDECRLRGALREKEVLLREVHHRVKNNLQLVASMLNLQADRPGDDAVRQLLEVSQARVRALAMIHDKLYRSSDLSRIPFADYLADLVERLVVTLVPSPDGVAWRMDADEIELTVDVGIPLALIVNELVSNSLKHAFRSTSGNELEIVLRGDGPRGLVLSVADNGVGLPPDFDPELSDTLGLQLVSVLTKQLGGSVEFVRLDPGVKITIHLEQIPVDDNGSEELSGGLR